MESHLNFKYKFKIEPKPEGGFIARAEGSDVTIEGATKEEVEQKMLEKVSELAGPQLAEALKGLSAADLKKDGVHVGKKFSIRVNATKTGGAAPDQAALPGSAPALDQNAGPILSAEPAISRQLLWAIIVALTLFTIWLAMHRR